MQVCFIIFILPFFFHWCVYCSVLLQWYRMAECHWKHAHVCCGCTICCDRSATMRILDLWPNLWRLFFFVAIGFVAREMNGVLLLIFVRTGAPRLLQAIAADGVIPFINPFSVTNLKGEPRRALYLTATIAETGVLLANVDYIAPIITMCDFLPHFTSRHWLLSRKALCTTVTRRGFTSNNNS